MVDILFAAGQCLCIVGLLYGAYQAITFRAEDEPARKQPVVHDPLTTHMWRAQGESQEHWLRRAA